MNTTLLLLILIIGIIITDLVILTAAIMIFRVYKTRLSLDDYAIRLEQDVQKSRDLLNNLVENALIEWSIFHVRTEEEAYINDVRRDECLEWVIKRVVEQSTPSIMDQIRIGYPASNLDEYLKSIKDVALIHVTNFVIKQNTKMMDDGNPNSYINISGRI